MSMCVNIQYLTYLPSCVFSPSSPFFHSFHIIFLGITDSGISVLLTHCTLLRHLICTGIKHLTSVPFLCIISGKYFSLSVHVPRPMEGIE